MVLGGRFSTMLPPVEDLISNACSEKNKNKMLLQLHIY